MLWLWWDCCECIWGGFKWCFIFWKMMWSICCCLLIMWLIVLWWRIWRCMRLWILLVFICCCLWLLGIRIICCWRLCICIIMWWCWFCFCSWWMMCWWWWSKGIMMCLMCWMWCKMRVFWRSWSLGLVMGSFIIICIIIVFEFFWNLLRWGLCCCRCFLLGCNVVF